MSKRYIVLPIVLVVLACIGQSFGESDGTGTMENATMENATSAAGEALGGNESPASNATAGPGLSYIWSVTGIEEGPITMVLEQEGDDLFGQAKYEPEGGEAWNAEVVGSVMGDEVDLTLTARKGEELVATRMSGTYANESISGTFAQVRGGKILDRGNFTAIWISPDTSSYTPASVEEPKVEAPAAEEPANVTIEDQTTQQEKSRFVDVRQFKDKIGPGGDLSGVPPGMGGSGLS